MDYKEAADELDLIDKVYITLTPKERQAIAVAVKLLRESKETNPDEKQRRRSCSMFHPF